MGVRGVPSAPPAKAGWLVKNVSAPTKGARRLARGQDAAEAVSSSRSVAGAQNKDLLARHLEALSVRTLATGSRRALFGFTSMAIKVAVGISSRSSSESLCFEFHTHHGHAGSVPARPAEAATRPKLKRVGGHVEYDWEWSMLPPWPPAPREVPPIGTITAT